MLDKIFDKSKNMKIGCIIILYNTDFELLKKIIRFYYGSGDNNFYC